MKTATTEKLTRAYLERLDRSTYIATVFALLIVLLSLFWTLFRLGGNEGTVLFAEVMYALFSCLGAYYTCRTAYRARKGPVLLPLNYQMGWLCVGAGLLANSLGGIYYVYLEAIHQRSFPSYADLGFSLLYPLIFIGLLLMPTEMRFRLRMGLDALITTLCFLGVSWFFVIGPLCFVGIKRASSVTDLLALLVGISYPCWDILLILAIALLIQRRTELVLHPSFLLFAVGVVSLIWADTGYAYTSIFTHTYQLGTPWIDPFWFIGYILMGLASLYQYTTIARRTYREQAVQASQVTLSSHSSMVRDENGVVNDVWRRFQSLLIYIPLTFLLGLTIFGELIYRDQRTDYLVVLTAIIGILVAVRYLRATHENEILLQERERERRDAEHLRQLSTTLTNFLDIEPLLENIAALATTELKFDAALLIVLEEHSHDIGPQSHVLVNTSSTTTPATKWRLQGDTFFYYLVLNENVTEIHWDTLTHDVPADIHMWQQEQHISTMRFFPLVHQGTILGCLGVAYRTSRSLGTYDVSLAKTYAEQAATIIKHAYLYKDACEHEAFAHAMANIATRLNSAVVAPVEIQQLICTEGANAIQADHAILYVPGDRGQLVSLASYNASAEEQPLSSEWPPIQPHESEAQVFYALQPVLIHLTSQVMQATSNERTSFTRLYSVGQGTNGYAIPSRTREQRRNYGSALREKLVLHNIDTAILAPLISGGEPVGLLVFGRSVPPNSREKQSFDKETLPLAQDFAEQASVALTNAHLYQHLRSAHKQMQELDALKDQFMVTASHELRTPLTAVQGYIELLSQYDDILPTEQRREFLQKARRSCEELVVMLSNVMDASRLEMEAGIRPAFLERVDVWEMVESVITIIEPQVQQEQRQIHVSIPARTFVLADPIRLRQILMNISVNALKYSPQHTPIFFSASIYATHTPSVVLSIADKGKGIKPQDHSRLFQRFVRLEGDVNSPVRGSGLGLYISRRLIESMGGKIWIESKGIPGDGSIFHIQLSVA